MFMCFKSVIKNYLNVSCLKVNFKKIVLVINFVFENRCHLFIFFMYVSTLFSTGSAQYCVAEQIVYES